MRIEPTAISDVKLIRPDVHRDKRGYFVETWNQNTFESAGLRIEFVQDNYSRSAQGTLRGLHYQVQQPQGKLMRVAAGTVFDVCVDLRRSSPSFGKWVGTVLTAENFEQLWVPPGFAHGFLVLSEFADFSYKCTDFYAPAHERTIAWDDPTLAIDWPLQESVELLLSDKDRQGSSFSNAENYQ